MTFDDMPQLWKDHIIKSVQKDRDYTENHFWITEMIACPRKSYFNRTLGAGEITIDRAMPLFGGNLWDAELTSLHPKNQIRMTHRVHGHPIMVSGRLDFFDADGSIADLKRIKTLDFVRTKPKIEHIMQVMFYCYCNASTKARICYLSDGGYIKHDLDFDEEELQEFIMCFLEPRAVKIYEAIQKKVPPEFEENYSKKYWECQYRNRETGKFMRCDFFNKCYPEDVLEESKKGEKESDEE